MIKEERIFSIICSKHVSEKSTISAEQRNTIVLKVLKSSKKYEIKQAVEKIFSVKVDEVRTLIEKGKKKGKGNRLGFSKSWKKAFIKIKNLKNTELKNLS